ncbi:hypothetical protein C8R45DRAFT_186452 [Mycena sanguinolenta]|nr:hypothetical protein C8R45DRAFT_186452 [Mycena sanguinolenta]
MPWLVLSNVCMYENEYSLVTRVHVRTTVSVARLGQASARLGLHQTHRDLIPPHRTPRPGERAEDSDGENAHCILSLHRRRGKMWGQGGDDGKEYARATPRCRQRGRRVVIEYPALCPRALHRTHHHAHHNPSSPTPTRDRVGTTTASHNQDEPAWARARARLRDEECRQEAGLRNGKRAGKGIQAVTGKIIHPGGGGGGRGREGEGTGKRERDDEEGGDEPWLQYRRRRRCSLCCTGDGVYTQRSG